MTYIDDEKADLDPIEFYEFTFGGDTWRFTDCDENATNPATGLIHLAEPIKRGKLAQSEEDSSMSVEVSVDTLNPVADFFRAPYLPSKQVWLTITRGHVGSAYFAILFRGKVGQCVFNGTTARLTCVPARNAIVKKVPIQLVQRLCNNTLYDGRCKADPADFSDAGSVLSVFGLFITVDGPANLRPEGYFNGGYVERVDGRASATILDSTIQLAVPPDPSRVALKLLYNPGFQVGNPVIVYAGCDRRLTTCIEKFNNARHFQGYPFIPVIDPFKHEPNSGQ